MFPTRTERLASWRLLVLLGTGACGRSSLDYDDDYGARADATSDDVTTDSGRDGAEDARPEDGETRDVADEIAVVCGPASCTSGCCLKGECIPPLQQTSRHLCGNHGETCEECTGEFSPDGGTGCRFGATCVREQPQCGPANCNGCCLTTSICTSGIHGSACGRGGQPCSRCIPTEGTGTCVAQPNGGGLCQDNPPCSVATCTGCCWGDICATGTQAFACGTKGQQCLNCVLIGQQCTSGLCTK